MTSLWPERTFKEFIRVAVLLIFLVFTVKVTLDLLRFEPGSVYVQTMTRLLAARLLENSARLPKTSLQTTLSDSDYGLSILDQTRIAAACEQFVRARGVLPSSVEQLRAVGLSSEYYLDPWKRPYKLRVLEDRVLIVQSTGKSGIDRISPAWSATINSHLQPPVQVIDDNLIFVKKLIVLR